MSKVPAPALCKCAPPPHILFVCPIRRKDRAQVFEVKDVLQLLSLTLDLDLGLLRLRDFVEAHLAVCDCVLELLLLFGFVAAPSLVDLDAEFRLTRLVTEGTACVWVSVVIAHAVGL